MAYSLLHLALYFQSVETEQVKQTLKEEILSTPTNRTVVGGHRRRRDNSNPLVALDNRTSHARHEVRRNTTISTPSRLAKSLARLPSVDFVSCCGLGHRLSKVVDAYYLAKQLHWTLRIFFGFCGNQEIFSHFFDPPSVKEIQAMTAGLKRSTSSNNMYLKVSNEVPGFSKLVREGPNATTTCRCPADRFESDVEFFSSLRERFRGRDKVTAFRNEHFAGRTVLGLHVRAGNGETGDFEQKNRTIADMERWTQSMVDQLISLAAELVEDGQPPPILFIATDTAKVLELFRTLLNESMPVVDLSQARNDDGEGVLFGASGNVLKAGEKCMDGWEAVILDMMLLSYADVLIAGRPSSFTQSLPMTMVLATPRTERKAARSFCEVNPSATAMVCFDSLMDWCCNGTTSFNLHSIQRYDYRRMPREPQGLDPKLFMHMSKMRPPDAETGACMPGPGDQVECLPLQMPDADRLSKLVLEKKAKRRRKAYLESRTSVKK